MNRALTLTLPLTLVLSCSSPATAPPADLARAAAPAPAPPPAPAVPMKATSAEVEMRGTVTLPKGAHGDVHVYVTDAPCWKPETRALADIRASEGRFFAEVIVKQGMQLWVCAALVPPSGPITVSGALASAPLKGEGEGEVTYNDLAITLAAGKPVERPAPRTTSATR